MTCQRNWLYLESIFSAPDILRQLPAEAKMFMQVDKSWKDVMRKVYRLPNALRAATTPGLLETFQNNNALLDQIQKCLEAYLESKCVIFPRCVIMNVIICSDVLQWLPKAVGTPMLFLKNRYFLIKPTVISGHTLTELVVNLHSS